MAGTYDRELFYPGQDAMSHHFQKLMGDYLAQMAAQHANPQMALPNKYPTPDELQRLGEQMLAFIQIWDGQQRLAKKGVPQTYEEVRDFWYDAVRVVPDWAWKMGPVFSVLFVGNAVKEHLPEEHKEMLEAFLKGYARGRPSPAMDSMLAFNPFLQSQYALWKSFMP
ncbi:MULTISPECIES: hypothetical protein [Pseudovibrio]|uniref:hypothetical protein n=1 Tax=Stappiaceae TaxID=2821832 RepID=UPI0023666A06|nr:MULTISPECIES: hypothetical protein [Pseudovibrio]MDD7911389.1 hypothetical protein [Pseudovibrio exalbescens]MDX5592924.1 hypothetical protein [Pseudovibrio sp. SPO723]